MCALLNQAQGVRPVCPCVPRSMNTGVRFLLPRDAITVPPRGLDRHTSGGAVGRGSAQQRIEALLVVPLRSRAHQPLDLAAILEDDQRRQPLDAKFNHTAVPLSERWQAMARGKLADVERLIRHAREVRQTLISGLRCGCPNLHGCIDCVLKQCA
jgi:hypothetical protein